MKKIVVFTPADTAAGFRLAGLEQQTADRDGLLAALAARMADPACGLLIIDERLLDGAAEQKIRAMEADWEGVVVTLPAPPLVETAGEDYTADLLRKAIGYHVRLNI